MTSVGIMSMQRIHNYGSTLQAYSLRRLIEAVVPDAHVSFVDYRPGPVLGAHGAAPVSRLGRAIGKAREYAHLEASLADRLRFIDHKRGYAKRYLAEVGIPPTPDHDLDLDCQVIGSDEVFNCLQRNTNVGYARDLFGHDSPARRLVSYAASFGNTTLERIRAAGIEADLRDDLLRFDALSVRDSNSRAIVQALTDREPPIHVDPALAHDLALDPRVPAGRLHDEPYLVVYGYSGRLTAAENDALRAHARRIGARILTFGGVQASGDAFVDCTPFELLAYFRDAVGVVTDTFHGTIFSIINHRPFATIVRPSTAGSYGNEEKLGFLLESFGLSSRRLVDAASLGEVLSSALDVARLDTTLATQRARSREYLAASVVAAKQETP